VRAGAGVDTAGGEEALACAARMGHGF
jgi:hypothetical protein